MHKFFYDLFVSGKLIPYSICYQWPPQLAWVHIISASLIALAYYLIALTIVYFLRKRGDLPYRGILLLLSTLSVACGTIHILEVSTLWHPSYWLSGICLTIAAIILACTAVQLILLLPIALAFPSLAVETRKRESEIIHRQPAEAELRKSTEQYRTLVKNFPNGAVLLFDLDLRCTRAGGKGLTEVGLSKEQLEGKTIWETFPPETCAALEPNYRAALAGEATILELAYADCIYQIHTLPVKNEQGEIYAGIVIAQDITTRKRMEETLQESGQIFRATFNQAAVGMAHMSLDGKWMLANPKLCEILGYTAAEILQLKFQNITHPDDIDIILEGTRQILAGKACNYLIETRYIRKDNSHAWVNLNLSLIRTATGEPKYFVVIIEDISSRKQAFAGMQKAKDDLENRVVQRTKELKHANEKLEYQLFERDRADKKLQDQAELLDLAHDAIVTLDLKNIITFWNRGAEEMYGWTKAEALGKEINTLLRTQFPKPQAKINEFLWQHGYWQGEIIDSKKDGSSIAIASRWTVKRDLRGRPIEVLKINTDITERKKVQEALIASSIRLAAILDIAEDAIISINQTQQITLFNQGAERIFGYNALEVLNQPLSLLLPERCASAHYQHIAEYSKSSGLARKMGERGKIFGRRKNGTEFPAEASISQLELEDEKIFTVILRDITEQVQTEEALRAANEKLTSWVNELEQRNSEIVLLAEMSDILQACLTIEEAHSAIANLVQPLFPDVSGAVFVISSSQNLVETVASWGDEMLDTYKLFTPNECWALRRGHSHLVASERGGLPCKHIHPDSSSSDFLCVPMMAQGEALGVLYLSSQHKGLFTEAKQQLAVTVAEHIALALANLKLHEALKQQSIRDSLTGLFNRRYLEESLEREINRAARQNQNVGVIMLDVDHFKRFNDTFGHEAGDSVLRELGMFIKKHVRGSDIACRYGGEELTLILPEASLEITTLRAEQIREGVKHLNLQNRRQSLGCITLSLGVAVFPDHGTTGGAVIEAADAALYRAKQEGRDRVNVSR